MCREEGSLAGPDGFDKWADPKATFRLHEGISNPSRAEDLPHLHRLQKSSTKPRSGALLHLCRRFLLFSCISNWLQSSHLATLTAENVDQEQLASLSETLRSSARS